MDSAREAIERLLDDEKVMQADNRFTFEQRSQKLKIKLLESSLALLADDDYHGVHAKVKELSGLIYGTGIGQLDTDINQA